MITLATAELSVSVQIFSPLFDNKSRQIIWYGPNKYANRNTPYISASNFIYPRKSITINVKY